MTEQHMPARIWVEDTRDYGSWFDHPNETRPVKYIRADIAERTADALLDMLREFDDPMITDDIKTQIGMPANTVKALQKARSALSAFKASQSEANHG